MAEASFHGLALGYGNGKGMVARFEVVQAEIDRLGGCTRAPTAPAEVAAGDTIPEIARHRVPFAVTAAVAAPWGVAEPFFTIDDNHVLLGVELVAATPATMACADVAQRDASVILLGVEVYGDAVGAENGTIVLACHFEHVASVEERQR